MDAYRIFDEYRKISTNTRQKGDLFERFIKKYLQTDPLYSDRLSDVWLWMEFPGREGRPDTGIDLVAYEKAADEYWAIQCKFFSEGHTIDKHDIDSFLSASGKKFIIEGKEHSFSKRMIVSSTNNWGRNAEDAIANQKIPVTRIRLDDLASAPIEWARFSIDKPENLKLSSKKKLRPHQKDALEAVNTGFSTHDRGKLIMACGTGKTFTALKIAETITGSSGRILFLVPSISLLSQTLREWTAESECPIHSIAVCSDTKVSKDNEDISTVDLALPASTDPKKIAEQYKLYSGKQGIVAVFSTYQSIEVVQKAQKSGMDEFDLVICDEAHRTTGVTLSGADESAFVRIHDSNFIKAGRRLYMTATPRIYRDDSKTLAAEKEAVLCSMDDEKIYGPEFHHLGFSEAVEKGLLSDYKVLILAVDEKHVSKTFQLQLADKNNELNLDDTVKIIGCWNGLSKKTAMLTDEDETGTVNIDPLPMKRAVAFNSRIKDSETITSLFTRITEEYSQKFGDDDNMVKIEIDHVDGTYNALKRNEKLDWLKATPPENTCRILSNARCLSEGVDVPALDAVMFLNPRNSIVDVVQSVGRVMRRAEGKQYGYVILPIGIPSGLDPSEALNDNKKYKVVWDVLQALRAHDDRFNNTINKLDLNKKKSSKVQVIGVGGYSPGDEEDESSSKVGEKNRPEYGSQMTFEFPELENWKNAIYAKIVNKCGSRRYWENWAQDVAKIAERHIDRINTMLESPGAGYTETFNVFLEGLRKNLNRSITKSDAVEMLAQHLITRPVFEALFEKYSFVKNNPVSIAMQKMLDLLDEQALEKETETLDKFYESVKTRAKGIDNAEGRQKIIIELYDKFFKTAFPTMAEKLGIVYTPVEVVDFIINSVNEVLRNEFDRSLGDENVHILDPFTGTGTFVTRLIQSGLIGPAELEHKFKTEIHANEIVLLAYYIAAVNIENAYHDLMPQKNYTPFDGICLTDTFQLSETDENTKLFSEMFPHNSERVAAQKKAPLRVIIGNPPYSVGQRSANDNAQNQSYPVLDARISGTYAALTDATNKNSLYDSYIRAFRWSADRLDKKHGGIIAFVSNGSWLDGNAADGFRKSLESEFSSIYVFNLRGNARTQGELRRQEAGNVFGGGSRTPIAITILVKKPESSDKAVIYYHDIGDYHSREDKLAIISRAGSVSGIEWQILEPNQHGDWISLRDDLFGTFIPLGDKDNKSPDTFFVPYYSNGLKTQRDAWCYNSSLKILSKNIKLTLRFYDDQKTNYENEKKKNPDVDANKYIDYDSRKISWTRALVWDIEKGKNHSIESGQFVVGYYRPFYKQNLYFSRSLNEMVYQIPKLYPTPETENLVICVSGIGGNKENTTIISNIIPDLNCLDAGTQCFPLYYYEEKKDAPSLFDANSSGEKYIRRDGVSDYILNLAREKYSSSSTTKEDIFYFVYGFLHSPDYRERFANDLKKMLPRLPLPEKADDFHAFSKAGRELADLHLKYETTPPAAGVTVKGAETGFFKVEKMRFPKKDQKDTIIYNSKITVENIPPEVYDYVINGKSAVEWVMERYQVTVHKESGIKNDPNDWAEETGNPRYILDLLLSVMTVSLKTIEIVKGLPKAEF
jgi:predicted helicase